MSRRHEERELSFGEQGWLTAEAVLLTKDEEEWHQMQIKFAAHTSLIRLIVFQGTLQLSNLMLVNAVQVEVGHV